MSDRTDCDFLSDIQEAVRRKMAYTAGMTYESFLADEKTQDAVIRDLEIIGEAAKNVSAELRAKYPDVPWKSMVGVRDRLIHHYFGVNLDIVGDSNHRTVQSRFATGTSPGIRERRLTNACT